MDSPKEHPKPNIDKGYRMPVIHCAPRTGYSLRCTCKPSGSEFTLALLHTQALSFIVMSINSKLFV
jgi:hypothetical protein